MTTRVALAVIGTHGDVQPFVALARALKKRGFSVVLGSSGDFEGFVSGHGIEFFNLGGDVQAFLQRSQFETTMNKNSLLYASGLLRDGQKILREAARRAWTMAQDADAIVFQNATPFCNDIAEALDIPALLAVFQPISPTTEFPYFEYGFDPVDPLLYRFARTPFARSPRFDPVINRLSYVVQKAQQSYWDLPRDRLRRMLGLKLGRKGNLYTTSRGERRTVLHAYSATISPKAGDWPETDIITGFWRYEEAPWQAPPELEAFIAKGRPPIYLGFGSMPWGAQRNTEVVARALAEWGGRVVIGKGWGGIRAEALPDNVHAVDRAPHGQLFPLLKAVVHHGGAGTTHTGLLAGRPTFVVPQFFDQPYWGQRLYELGVGPSPVRLRKLTPHILASALDDLDNTPAYARAAEALGARLRLEDGTNLAVDVIEETIAAHGRRVTRPQKILGAAK